jgi:succinyl-diaminopimelate desuccinylase
MARLELNSDAIELTRTLCDIPSVSGAEGELADAIEAAVRRLPHLSVIRDGDAIVARTETGRPQRAVIAGHIDTVPVHGNLPSRFVELDGEPCLWGRGSVDMKAGVAVQLLLAAEFSAPRMDVTWIWYDNEEVDESRNGLARLERTRPDLLAGEFAVLGEPTSAVVEGGCNGDLNARIVTSGRRAHSARSWMGENAIHRAVDALRVLDGHRAAEVEVDGLVYREGLNAVRIGGGVAGNVVPDRCELEVNYRFAPSTDVAGATAYLGGLFPNAEIEVLSAAGGARPGLDSPLAQEFLAAIGGTPRPKYGWTDLARFAARGTPGVNYGPGDPNLAHHDEERVPLSQIRAVERGLRRWLSGAGAAAPVE